MINTLLHTSHKKITLTTLLIALMLFLLFIILVLPNEAERSDEYFGDSPTPDTSFFYSGDDLYQMAGDFGPEGRTYYIRSRFTFDILWPLAYGFFLWAGIAYLVKPFKSKTYQHLLLLPFLGVILDFFENTGASIVMYYYPDRIPVLTDLVPFFTLGKWITIIISFAVLIFLLFYRCIFLLRSLSRKN